MKSSPPLDQEHLQEILQAAFPAVSWKRDKDLTHIGHLPSYADTEARFQVEAFPPEAGSGIRRIDFHADFEVGRLRPHFHTTHEPPNFKVFTRREAHKLIFNLAHDFGRLGVLFIRAGDLP